jgi:ketosteroid isomerase-like protein
VSTPEVELAKRLWRAIQRRDLDEFLSMVDPEIEFVSFLERDTYRGHDGLREWWSEVIASLGGIRFEPLRFDAIGDDGVLTQVVLIGTADSVDVEQTIWQVAEMAGDKVIWWGSYGTEREARESFQTRVASE